MATATETKPQTKPTTFIAKCENLVLVVEPRFPRFNHLGLRIGNDPGKRVEFDRGEFTTDDPELIEWLRAHRNFNVPSNQGFYEVGNAPDEPRPTIAEQHAAIEGAVAERDVEALEAVVAEEKATHNREVVFAAARIAARALAGKVEGGKESPSTSTD